MLLYLYFFKAFFFAAGIALDADFSVLMSNSNFIKNLAGKEQLLKKLETEKGIFLLTNKKQFS